MTETGVTLETTSEERTKWAGKIVSKGVTAMLTSRLLRDVDRLLADNEAKAGEIERLTIALEIPGPRVALADALAEIARLKSLAAQSDGWRPTRTNLGRAIFEARQKLAREKPEPSANRAMMYRNSTWDRLPGDHQEYYRLIADLSIPSSPSPPSTEDRSGQPDERGG